MVKTLEDKTSNREASRAMYDGVTMYDLEQLFHVTRRTVQRKLSEYESTGKRGAYDTWKLKDVAGLFVKPTGNMEEFIKAAQPQDLPVLLQKEYWNGLRAKQAFMENEGDLWRTDRVAALFGDAFQIIRTSLLLLPDELERRAGMTDQQRNGFQEGIDAALDQLQNLFQETFKTNEDPANLAGAYYIIMPTPPEDDDDDLEDVFEAVDDDEDL